MAGSFRHHIIEELCSLVSSSAGDGQTRVTLGEKSPPDMPILTYPLMVLVIEMKGTNGIPPWSERLRDVMLHTSGVIEFYQEYVCMFAHLCQHPRPSLQCPPATLH
jgi:hypothetical protein